MPIANVNWLWERPIPAGVILGWSSTNASIPYGWTRVTSLDARFVKGNAAATDPGGTGGAANHDHPFSAHSHTGNDHNHTGGPTGAGSLSVDSQGAFLYPVASHTHTFTVGNTTTVTSANNTSPTNWDATTVDPLNLVVIFIQSAGTTPRFPSNVLAYYNGAAPLGWAAYANGTNNFWKGAATNGDGGATGGSGNSHSHTATHGHPSNGTHTHTLTIPAAPNGDRNANGTPNASMSTNTHTHSGSSGAIGPDYANATPTSTNGDMTPAWKKMLTVQNTSGGSILTNLIIAMWLGTLAAVPLTWHLCDGNAGTPNLIDTYVNGAANSGEVGNTGGAATHTHGSGGSHTHSINVHIHPSVNTGNGTDHTVLDASPGNSLGSDAAHVHATGALSNDGSGTSGSQTVSGSANSSNDPVFTRVAYIQYTG